MIHGSDLRNDGLGLVARFIEIYLSKKRLWIDVGCDIYIYIYIYIYYIYMYINAYTHAILYYRYDVSFSHPIIDPSSFPPILNGAFLDPLILPDAPKENSGG